MAFGKITVANESGEFEEYELTRSTTSVGRQPGNDIVLNSSAISRYHAQFDVFGGQVFLVDLGTVNGTFINDEQVDPNSRSLLNDGDVVTLGDLRLTFNATKRRPGASGMLSLNPKVYEDPNVPIRLTFDDPDIPVAPGAYLQLALVIENQSGVERMFLISVEGMEPDWLKLNRREVRLDNEEQTEVIISVRPPRFHTTRPGNYALQVKVSFKDDPEQSVTINREIEVLGFSGIAMAIRDGSAGNYSFAIQNQGNHPVGIKLRGYDRAKQLNYQFNKSDMWIDPGDTSQVQLKVKIARKPARSIPFAVVAKSGDKSGYQAPLAARFTSETKVESQPSTVAVAAGIGIPAIILIGLGLIIVGVAGLWLLGFIRLPIDMLAPQPATEPAFVVTASASPPTFTPPPSALPIPVVQVTQFEASPDDLVFGTSDKVSFSWTVDGLSNVQDYVLYEPDAGVEVPLDAAAWVTGRLEIPPGDLVTAFGWDLHNYTLTVTGNDGAPRSITTSVKITPVKCTMQSGSVVVVSPGPAGSVTPIAPPSSREVVVGGRTADASWIQVWSFADHILLGWIPTNGLSCPLTPPINQFIVLQP